MPPPPNRKDTARLDLPTENVPGKKPARLGLLIGVAIVFCGLVIAVANLQKLQDWWRLRGYQPPSAVSRLADQDTMNNYTRHLFYLNRPQLLNTVSSFRQNCPENKDTIVLGCYHPGQKGIYIYAVQDPDLAGIQQVTAAHEVLHAVYARLNGKERTQLNGELNDFYKHGLTDQRVISEVKLYQQTEPTAVMDEMSCTFGTEVAKLPAPLEAYYERYFTDRAAIVAYEQQYEGAFTSRQNTIQADDARLSDMKQRIDSQEAALGYQLDQINSDRSRLNALLAGGQTAAYNAAVPGFNHEIAIYNESVNSLRSDIDSYNRLVAARNQVAGELTTLDKAIDTRQIPQVTH